MPIAKQIAEALEAAHDVQQGQQYNVAPDGCFMINAGWDSAAAPITLLRNWNPERKK